MEVVSIVKMILFTVAFWLFLIVIGFHTPAKRTKKITELLMGGMILFFFLFEILALCAVFFRWKFHTLYWLVLGISVVLFVSSIVQKTKRKQTLVSSGGCLNSRSDVCRDFLHTH